MMRLVKELKGGSLSKTVVMSNDQSQWVRKYVSIQHNREYGLVRWQSQLRKLQTLRAQFPEHVLPVLSAGVDGDYYYFDIPYVNNCQNLYEEILNCKSFENIAQQLASIIKMMADRPLEAASGSLSIYLNEELKRPLQNANKVLDGAPTFLSPKECIYFKKRFDNELPNLDDTISGFQNHILPESLTHGNFTLENAIWDRDNNKILLIDFYAETYCETILGDISQIFQSSRSGYEAVSALLGASELSITQYPYKKIPKKLIDFSHYFESLIVGQTWYDPPLINLFRASQFTRMFPFKLVNNPRSGFLFINHALDLLGN